MKRLMREGERKKEKVHGTPVSESLAAQVNSFVCGDAAGRAASLRPQGARRITLKRSLEPRIPDRDGRVPAPQGEVRKSKGRSKQLPSLPSTDCETDSHLAVSSCEI